MVFTAKLLLIIVLIIQHKWISTLAKNNVCRTYEAYNEIETSPDCFYEADVDLNGPEEILKRHANRYEVHEVTTEDGYTNTIYRIPKDNPKGVILLVHPLTADALVWISMGNHSIPFCLMDNGYDVWMPSFRGTYISHKHVNMSYTDFLFSDYREYSDRIKKDKAYEQLLRKLKEVDANTTRGFRYDLSQSLSYHELAIYDMRSWINYITEKTNRSDLVYIGYSMSAGTPLIYGSLFPEESRNSIKVYICVGTPYNFKYVTTPFTTEVLMAAEKLIRDLTDSMNVTHIYSSPLIELSKKLIMIYPSNKIIASVLREFFGSGSAEIMPEVMARSVVRLPRGFSLKTYYHFLQLIAAKRMQQFDYGNDNQRVYGQALPPEYPVEKITTPIYLIYSEDDLLTTAKDAKELYHKMLPPEAKIYGMHEVKKMNHMTYFLTRHTKEELLDHIVHFINKIFK